MTQDTITPASPSEPVNVDELKAKIVELSAAQDAAEQEAMAAATNKDIRGMISATDKAKQAMAGIERVQKQIDRAEYDVRKVERENLVQQFVDNVPGLFAQVDVANVRSLSITGLVVSFNEDGTVSCTVNTKAKDAGVNTKIGSGKTRGGTIWLYNGTEYKSRELISQFGGDEGVAALDKADNPGKYNLKYSPGFNAFVVGLASKLGAVKVEKAA